MYGTDREDILAALNDSPYRPAIRAVFSGKVCQASGALLPDLFDRDSTAAPSIDATLLFDLAAKKLGPSLSACSIAAEPLGFSYGD